MIYYYYYAILLNVRSNPNVMFEKKGVSLVREWISQALERYLIVTKLLLDAIDKNDQELVKKYAKELAELDKLLDKLLKRR